MATKRAKKTAARIITPAEIAAINASLKSGDKFFLNDDSELRRPYLLQKLPDVDAWLLVSKDEKGSYSFWCAPASTPLSAFGGWFPSFTKIVDERF